MPNIKEQNPKQIESPGQEGEGWSAWGVDPMSRTPDLLVRCVLRGGRDPQRARCESRHPAARRQPSPERNTLPRNRSPPLQYHPINPPIPKPIPFPPTTTTTTNKLSPSHQTSNQKQPNQLPSITQSTLCLLPPPQSPIQISVYSHHPHAPHSKPTSQNPLHSPTHLVPPPNPIPSIPIQIPLSLHPKPTPIKTPKNNSLYPPNHYIILL